MTGQLRRPLLLCGALSTVACAVAIGAVSHARPRPQDADAPRPISSQPIPRPKIDGIVTLFSGKADELAQNWVARDSDKPAGFKFSNGVIESGGGDITTKQMFTDYLLHVEFWEPYLPNNHGQERGNSGIALDDLYEIQVLDSYGIKEPGRGDCGAVYDQSAPLVNACKPPLQWQTYDIIYRAARWDADGKKTQNAHVTVILNGMPVQNNTEIPHETGIAYGRKEHPGPGPILLQDHGYPVRFRNVWVFPLPEQGAQHY